MEGEGEEVRKEEDEERGGREKEKEKFAIYISWMYIVYMMPDFYLLFFFNYSDSMPSERSYRLGLPTA